MIVAPGSWRFNETTGVSSPIEPEESGIPGYKIHFFSFERGAKVSFDRPGEPPLDVELAKPSFLLTGRSLPDVDEEMGPLFAGEVPTLQASRSDDLTKIKTLILGVEGRGVGRWRNRFAFIDQSQDWREKIRAQGSGWYFVRLYDSEERLIDSLDFRYAAGLTDIEGAKGAEALDREYMHVKFIHAENVSVNLLQAAPHLVRRSASVSGSTAFSWEMDPNVRKISFGIQEGEKSVRVTVDADRIWWAVTSGAQDQSPDWQSSAIELDRDDLSPLSRTAILLQFPHLVNLRAFIGFDRDDRRVLTSKYRDHYKVDLNAFGDSAGVGSRTSQVLKLWVTAEGLNELELTVATLRVSHKCPWCELWMVDGEEMFDHIMNQHHDRCFERLVMKGECRKLSFSVQCRAAGNIIR